MFNTHAVNSMHFFIFRIELNENLCKADEGKTQTQMHDVSINNYNFDLMIFFYYK